MQRLIILTGAPGAGKTTLTAKLARALPKGCRIEGDTLYSFVANEYQSPLEDGGGACGALFLENTALLVRNFLRHGLTVVANHIFTPAGIDALLAAAPPPPNCDVRLVVVSAPLDVRIARDVKRREPEGQDAIERATRWFDALGFPAHLELDTTSLSLDEAAKAVLDQPRFVVNPRDWRRPLIA